MKRILIACAVALGAISIYAKDIKEMVVTTTPQMTCQNCENKIKGNLRFEKGVKNVETDLAAQTVKVTYDAEKTDESKITKAFEKLNYKVSPAGKHKCESEAKKCSGCCNSDKKECSGDCKGDKK